MPGEFWPATSVSQRSPGAGVLFMYASVPYRRELSSKWMLSALLVTNTLYICVLNISPAADWALDSGRGSVWRRSARH